MTKLVKYSLYVLTYTLVAALAIAYLSVWIPPDKFWIPAFFGLAFPYLLVINLILLVYWLIHLKKESIIILVVILLGWNNMMHYYRLPGNGKKEKNEHNPTEKISVLTFNVRSFNVYSTEKKAGKDQDIIRFLKNEKTDILCLQEFHTDDYRFPEEKIIKSLDYPYYFISYINENQYHSRYGLAVFSRYPLLNKKGLRFDESFNESQQCDVVIGKDTLRLFNNHLQSTQLKKREVRFYYPDEEGEALREVKDISLHLRAAFIKRAGQAAMLEKYIRQSPYPVLVCGDFNDPPVSYTYHMLSKGLKDAFVESGKGFGKTYHGIFPSFRIDYILHDPEWQALQYRTYHNHLSDHYPVSCVLIRCNASHRPAKE